MARVTWMNGQLVEDADARVPFLTAGLHYGMAVFEGIRCYQTAAGPAVFRLREHLERLEGLLLALGVDVGLPLPVDLRRAALRIAQNLPHQGGPVSEGEQQRAEP